MIFISQGFQYDMVESDSSFLSLLTHIRVPEKGTAGSLSPLYFTILYLFKATSYLYIHNVPVLLLWYLMPKLHMA